MTADLTEEYEKYKECRNYILDYDKILQFYPDYYKTKMELAKLKFISYEEAIEFFENNYRNSKLYKKLTKLAMAEEEKYCYMKKNMEFKYKVLSNIFDKLIISIVKLCELIDYIGHYPDTFPVPSEEEKNPKMEDLLEKYDIMVRYYTYDDVNKMQIMSDDIVRIIEKLNENLECLNTIILSLDNKQWLLTRKNCDAEMDVINKLIGSIDDFPLSVYQKEGKSRREEGKKYLKYNFGKDI